MVSASFALNRQCNRPRLVEMRVQSSASMPIDEIYEKIPDLLPLDLQSEVLPQARMSLGLVPLRYLNWETFRRTNQRKPMC